jgi:dephospho-CoA kinase
VLVLGLTGGIGSGKSAVAARLAEKPGVRVIHADDEAKRLMAEDAAVRAALVRRFGAATFDESGALDRAALAARVFGRPDEVAALNALVHPAVRGALRDDIEAARSSGVRLLVYEAALIHEIGADELVDAVLLVDADPETRIARVMERDGVSRDQVEARMAHQLDPAAFRSRADYVIENDGTLEELEAAVDALYARFEDNPQDPLDGRRDR